MIRTHAVSASQVRRGDHRLDGAFYCSEGMLARRALASSGLSLHNLEDLCVPAGLYIPHRFKRPYVRDPRFGIPYITGSSINLADPLQGCAYLSRDLRLIRDRSRLMLKPNTIVVTSSGKPGTPVYINDLFEGAIGSPDLLRIIPDSAIIPSGYLYAFLASPIGNALLTQGTYGGVIPHIEASHVRDVPVPRLNTSAELAIHNLIQQAAEKRVKASRKLDEVDTLVHRITGLPQEFAVQQDHGFSVGTIQTTALRIASVRIDAYHYIGYAGETQHWRSKFCSMLPLSEAAVQVFEPPIFKRIRAEDGVPYLLGAEVYCAHPRFTTRISNRTNHLAEYILRRDMIVFENAGQRYGLLGIPVYIGRTLDGNAATNNMTRITCRNQVDSGFLFALLRTQFGCRLLRRQSYGTSLPHIFSKQVADVRIPWPEARERATVADLVLDAITLRDEANGLEDEAQRILHRELEAETIRRRGDKEA